MPPALSAPAPVLSSPPVELRCSPSGEWSLWRGRDRLLLHGAGGDRHLELLRELGGTVIRTWGIEQLDERVGGRTLLDRCGDLGLGIMAGHWLGHERHGFSYSDPALVEAQRAKVLAGVRRHKHHPALSLWGLGNEMEGPNADGVDPRIWRELEILARLVKAEDPDHPICTIIAGAAAPKIQALMRDYPSLDILGINAYAEAPDVAQLVSAAGWTGPFILAEYGPVGHWQIRQTEWGAPIEPRSRTKAASYLRTLRRVTRESAGRCLGTFAFVWGQKQETTATWYGMFLRGGEHLPTVDAVSRFWAGRWPRHRAPAVLALKADFSERRIPAGALLHAEAKWRKPPGGAAWRCEWRVLHESTDRKQGGDFEAAPPEVPDCVLRAEDNHVELRAPLRPGPYRLFLYVFDPHGAASADNVPFFVE